MTTMPNEGGFLICPECGHYTKTKVLPDTRLERFPLYCKFCKRQFVIDYRRRNEDKLNIT